MRVLIAFAALAGACAASGDAPPPAAPSGSAAGSPVGESITAYFDGFAANRDFAGVVRVERGGALVYENAWGLADLETGTPITPETRFGVASVTKTFTAHALVTMRDRGLVDFEAPLSTYFPDFAHGGAIKVKHLVRFESGLPKFPDLVGPGVDVDRAEGLDILGRGELLFTPGEGDAYSNEGFFVIARLVEKVTGTPFEDVIRGEFLDPLGLDDTGDRARPGFDPAGLSRPYVPGPPPAMLRPGTGGNASQSLGSGSMYSTAEDLADWGLAVARDRFADLDAEYWPWGWGKTDVGGRAGLDQTGANEGWVSNLTVYPDEELVIVVLSNIDYGLWTEWGRDVTRLLDGEATVLSPEPYDLAEAVDPRTLAAAPGRYVLEGRIVDIRADDGELYLYLDEWPSSRHLLALRDGSFQLRDFTGVVRFEDADGDGTPEALNWTQPAHWGGETQVYRRAD